MPVGEVKERLQGHSSPEHWSRPTSGSPSICTDNKLDLATTKLSYGPTLPIDTANETFVDNSAADALLTREYRAAVRRAAGRADLTVRFDLPANPTTRASGRTAGSPRPVSCPRVTSAIRLPDPGFDILLEDDDCLGVIKPPGIATQAPVEYDSLEARIKRYLAPLAATRARSTWAFRTGSIAR